MKEQKKDKFEAFMNESLSNYEEQPSELLWEQLEQNIPLPPKKDSYFNRWILLMVLLLLFGGGFWWIYNSDRNEINISLQNQDNKINTIAEEVAKIKSHLNKENKTDYHPSTEVIKEQQNSSPLKNQAIKEQKTELVISNKTILNNTFSEIKKTNTSKVKVLKSVNNSIKTVAEIDKNSESSQLNFEEKSLINENLNQQIETKELNSIDNNLKNNKQTAFEPLNKILNPTLENIPSIMGSVISKNKNTLNKIDLIELIGKERKIGFEFYFFNGAIFPKIDLASPINNFKKQNSKNFSIGLLHNIHFNKRWTLQIGLEFTERTIGTNFNKALEYGNEETLIANNQYQSISTYQVESNYGRQTITSYLLNSKMNDGSDIETGEFFSANINLLRSQKYFAIPLFFKYTFSNPYKKLQWSAKVGVIDRIYFRVNDSGTIEFQDFSHPRLKHDYTLIENIGHGNTPSTFGVEVVLGAGMEYHFNKNIGIIVEPKFKINVLETSPINPYSIGIYTGLRWTFNR